MCHHRRRPSFLPAEAAARPGTGTVCVRESVVQQQQYHKPSTPIHDYYIHTHLSLALSCRLIPSPLQPPHARLFFTAALLYSCIYTLTQPRLPDPADSAYFHCASIAVRLSRCNSTSHSTPTCSHPNLHPSSKQSAHGLDGPFIYPLSSLLFPKQTSRQPDTHHAPLTL